MNIKEHRPSRPDLIEEIVNSGTERGEIFVRVYTPLGLWFGCFNAPITLIGQLVNINNSQTPIYFRWEGITKRQSGL